MLDIAVNSNLTEKTKERDWRGRKGGIGEGGERGIKEGGMEGLEGRDEAEWCGEIILCFSLT